MKKFLCILISLLLLISSGILTVYGKNEDKGKPDTKVVTDLKDQLKACHKDKDKRKEIITQIVDEKRKKGDYSITVFINGEEVTTDVPPVIKSGRILIPVRPITNGLGADVQWNQTTQTITITKDKITVVLKLGSGIATVNGVEIKLDVPAEVINNRTMVPIRFIMEIFRKTVDWDDDNDSVIIEDDDSTVYIINDNDAGTGNKQFEYVGGWNYGTQAGAYMNDNHWSNYAGSYYQVRFVGTQIKLYGSKNSNHGIAGISIDGGTEANVDLYSAVRADNVLLYTSPVLPDKQHIIKVRMTGTKNNSATDYYITADKAEIIIVSPTPTPTSTPVPTSTPTLTPAPTATPTPDGRYEAENAPLSGGTFVGTGHTGYSGTGYVDGFNALGTSATFIINTPSMGIYNISYRYANATGAPRTLNIYLNGTKIKQLEFQNYSNWNTWAILTEGLALNPGNNFITIKFDSGNSGGINLDYITVHPSSAH